MEPRRKILGRKIKRIIKYLPEHKHYFDFIIALLSIPALVTALVLNINNLQPKRTSTTTNSTPSVVVVTSNPQVVIPTQPVRTVEKQLSPQPTASASCINGIGTLNVSYPQEQQTVSDNPLCMQIDYNAGNYCQVVWRYRINGGNWSDYGNNSVCLYTLPNGKNVFDVQVKSLSSSSTQSYTRTFMYQGQITPTQMPSSTSTTSANQK